MKNGKTFRKLCLGLAYASDGEGVFMVVRNTVCRMLVYNQAKVMISTLTNIKTIQHTIIFPNDGLIRFIVDPGSKEEMKQITRRYPNVRLILDLA